MSDEIDQSQIVEPGYDPFDEVVEVEPVVEVENDIVEEENSEEVHVEENSEEVVEEDSEEDSKEEEEESEKNVEEELKEEVDLAKQIEEGSLQVDINEEKVSLQELKNSYIGQKEIARRFTEYDVKSKQLEKDVTEINTYVNEFASILKNGDAVGAMSYLGEFAGTPPYLIKEQLIAALRPEIIRREQMTATEIQNEYLSSQNTYLQEQRESELKVRGVEQARLELQNSINELRETNGIDEQTWKLAEESLKQTLSEGDELTPDLVVEAVNYGRMYEQAESVIKSSGEQLENADQWIEELVNVKEKYPEFTEEDLADVLKNALDTVKKSTVEQKLATKIEKKVVAKKQTKQSNVVQESEIDPELEDYFF